jgi:hypothetical protein
MKLAAAALATLLAASGAARAGETAASPTAKGTFKSKDVGFNVASAVAWNGPSFFEKKDPALIVAISNARVAAGGIADFLDRRRAFEKLIKDDETAVVYFEFTPQGKYRGLSYYFGSGNGCGFCSGEVTSTVKLSSGKLAGTLKNAEKDRPFDFSLDVPVLTDEHGGALPSDGGAPGKAYLAYHAALVKRDANALKPTLSKGRVEVWERSQKKGNLDGYVTFLSNDHPMKALKVTKGFATADKASLAFEGESAAGKVTGEVLLKKAQDAWGVDEELVDLKLD